MARGTPKIDETPFGKENDVTAVLHEVAVYLGLDVLDGLAVVLHPGDVDLDVEMADV